MQPQYHVEIIMFSIELQLSSDENYTQDYHHTMFCVFINLIKLK